MRGHGALGVRAERLSDGVRSYPRRQPRKLRVTTTTKNNKHQATDAHTHTLDGTFVRTCLLLPQVGGGQLQPAVRDDPGRGDPLPAGHPETLQDHHEHERDAGDSSVGEGQRWRRRVLPGLLLFDL